MANHGGENVAPPSLPPPPGPCPWLVYYSNTEGYEKQTFCCNISGPSAMKTYCKSIPALEDKKVLSSSYGWLVLYDVNTKLLSLCNSITFGDTIILPSLPQLSIYEVNSCVLLPDKNNNTTCLDNFRIMIFLKKFPSIMCGRVGADAQDWTEIRYSKDVEPHLHPPALQKTIIDEGRLVFFRKAVVCGGKIFAQLSALEYWYNNFHSLWSIEIVEKEEEFPIELVFSKLNVPAGDRLSFPFMCLIPCNKFYVMESGGELLFLYFFGGTLQFKVYRLNFDTLVWEKIKYLEDRALFISESYGLSCPASVSGSGRIYFTRGEDENKLYSFHMKDQSVSASLLPLCNSTSPICIMPRLLLSLEDDHCDQDNNINNKQQRILELDEISRDDHHIQLCNLPLDVLEQISKNLLIPKDYMNFRATSRICQSVAPPVNWRIRALSGSAAEAANFLFPSPLLMFADKEDEESVYKFLDPSNNNNYYLMRMPDSLDHKVIRYSNEGWLLLSESDVGICLYNPFIGNIISYTPQFRLGLEQCLFFWGKPSRNTIYNCFCVVSVNFILKTLVLVSIVDVDGHGEEICGWDELDSNRNFEQAMQTSPVLFEDAFYYLDQEGNLGKLTLGLEISWQVLDKPQKPTCCIDSFDHNFLLECGGQLISVFVGGVGKWVAVYKLNNDHQVWETVTSLDSYDLYLSPTSSLSVFSLDSYDLYLSPTSSLSVFSNLGGNRLYFPSVCGSEIVYFSVDKGKWHFSGSQDSSTHLYSTRWLVNSCWIKPNW